MTTSSYLTEVLAEVNKLAVQYTGIPVRIENGKKHKKVVMLIEGTEQRFAIPSHLKSRSHRLAFAVGMRNTIMQRTEQVKARKMKELK